MAAGKKNQGKGKKKAHRKKSASPKRAVSRPRKVSSRARKSAGKKARSGLPSGRKSTAKPSSGAKARAKAAARTQPPKAASLPTVIAEPLALDMEDRTRELPRPVPRTPATDSDRREHSRVAYGAWVHIVRQGRQDFCLAKDVSLGGMFLKSADPPPLGEEVRCLLLVENEPEPLELHGVVVRRSEAEQGFGVRFVEVGALHARRLKELVARDSVV